MQEHRWIVKRINSQRFFLGCDYNEWDIEIFWMGDKTSGKYFKEEIEKQIPENQRKGYDIRISKVGKFFIA